MLLAIIAHLNKIRYNLRTGNNSVTEGDGMETAYQKVKVHNELEWCQVTDLETKEKIEKVLLKNRVSYFVKWEKPKLFSNDKFGTCIFCVNQLQKEIADEALHGLEEEIKDKIKFINRKVDKTFY